MESFLAKLNDLIVEQEGVSIVEMIGALEITKAELLESLFEVDDDDA